MSTLRDLAAQLNKTGNKKGALTASGSQQEDLQTVLLALKQLDILDRADRFDPTAAGSKPTPTQQVIIEDALTMKYCNMWITGGVQSGKSAVAAYILAQFLRENVWKRPTRWGTEPLLIIWASRTSAQMEDSLLRKLFAFMHPDEYKVVRTGNIAQKISHVNGNEIRLLSHHCASEAWEKAMSFTAHIAFCDELPQDWRFIDQLIRRAQARQGLFAAFFTPHRPVIETRKMLEAAKPPTAQVYRLNALDNPIMSSTAKEGLLAALDTLSSDERENRLKGTWISSSNSVFSVAYEKFVKMVPGTYSVFWEHMEGADPAIQTAHGLIVMARDPRTNCWWVVDAKELKGLETSSPKIEIENVLKITSKYNIVRRVCDPANVGWYCSTANELGVKPIYMIPYDKGHRRPEMLKNLMNALGTQLFIAPTEGTQDLIECILGAEWKDGEVSKIKGSHKLHLLDALIYAWDCKLVDIENASTSGEIKTWAAELLDYNRKLREQESKKDKETSSHAIAWDKLKEAGLTRLPRARGWRKQR